MDHPLRLIFCIERLDVLHMDTETGLFSYRPVIVSTEKNVDGIALHDGHLGRITFRMEGGKTKLLHTSPDRPLWDTAQMPCRKHAHCKVHYYDTSSSDQSTSASSGML